MGLSWGPWQPVGFGSLHWGFIDGKCEGGVNAATNAISGSARTCACRYPAVAVAGPKRMVLRDMAYVGRKSVPKCGNQSCGSVVRARTVPMYGRKRLFSRWLYLPLPWLCV
jgi:hypothetical protein